MQPTALFFRAVHLNELVVLDGAGNLNSIMTWIETVQINGSLIENFLDGR